MRLMLGIMLFTTAVIASADNVMPETGEYVGLGQDYNLGHDRDDKHAGTDHGHSDKHDDRHASAGHDQSDNHGDEPDNTDHSHSAKHNDETVNTHRGHAHDQDMWIMRPELVETTIIVTDTQDLLLGSSTFSWAGDKWMGSHDASSHIEVTLQVFPTMNLFELLVFEDGSPVSGTRYYMVKTI